MLANELINPWALRVWLASFDGPYARATIDRLAHLEAEVARLTGDEVMPYIVSKPDDTVDHFRVEIGSEWIEHKFGRKVPVHEAVRLIRQYISTFAKETDHEA